MPLRVFPVSGGAQYISSFGAPRSDGRSHQGNDLMASEGTPLLAVDDGDVRFGTDPLGGNIANLVADDGTRYYYAHLSAFEGGNRRVQAGEVIGYVGRTGNAAATDPHVHFEVHPNRGAAVDPFPLLQAASVVTGAGSGGSLLRSVLLAGAVGLGVWALMNPTSARRLGRRLLP